MKEAKVARLRITWQVELEDFVTGISWSFDGKYLTACPSGGQSFPIYSLEGKKISDVPGHGLGNTAIEWNPVSLTLATAGQDGKVRMGSLESPDKFFSYRFPKGWVEKIAWQPSGKHLAASAGKDLVILDGEAKLIHQFSDSDGVICDLAWSPDGRQVALVGQGGVRVWDLEKGKIERSFSWDGASLAIRWSPDGRRVACADQTKTIHYWDLDKELPLHMWGYDAKVADLSWDFRGTQLATAGSEAVCIWDCSGPKGPEGTEPKVLEGHGDLITVLSYMRNGPLLASGGADKLGFIWWPERQTEPLAAAQFGASVSALAWSPLATSVAFGTEAGALAVCAPNA